MTAEERKSRGNRMRSPVVVYHGDTPEILLTSFDLKNTRDLRTLLLEAAYTLLKHPNAASVQIALYNTILSRSTIQGERDRFLSICAPSIATKIHITDLSEHAEAPMRTALFNNDQAALDARKPVKASQEAVIGALLQRYIHQQPSLSIDQLVKMSGASVPTVYKAINHYSHCIAQRSRADKSIRIHAFSRNDWKEWIERSNRLASVYFIDRSGVPRSAVRLAKGLARLQRNDLAVGGLMGALHHLPALDATAAPQLDILVHGTPRSDLSFIEEIDPGLKMTKDQRETAHVVVHFIDRPVSMFDHQDGQNYGTIADCIANMYRARQMHQVEDAIQRIQKAVLSSQVEKAIGQTQEE